MHRSRDGVAKFANHVVNHFRDEKVILDDENAWRENSSRNRSTHALPQCLLSSCERRLLAADVENDLTLRGAGRTLQKYTLPRGLWRTGGIGSAVRLR